MKSQAKQEPISRQTEATGTAISTMGGVAILFVLFALCPSASAEVFVSRYAVSLAGLPLGEAVIHASFSPDRYKVAVSADVGFLFINRKVQGEASGRRSGEKLTPDHFRVVMTGDEDNALDIRFAGSSPPVAKFTPPLPPRQVSNRVPLTEAHLKGVLDPLSALLATSLGSSTPSPNPCHDVLPIFTGLTRIDVSLHPKAGGDARKESAVVTCEVRYVAIAGHPRSANSDEPRNLKLEIDFKRLAKPHIWLLQHLSFPTPVGTVTVVRTETRVS